MAPVGTGGAHRPCWCCGYGPLSCPSPRSLIRRHFPRGLCSNLIIFKKCVLGGSCPASESVAPAAPPAAQAAPTVAVEHVQPPWLLDGAVRRPDRKALSGGRPRRDSAKTGRRPPKLAVGPRAAPAARAEPERPGPLPFWHVRCAEVRPSPAGRHQTWCSPAPRWPRWPAQANQARADPTRDP